VAVSFVRYRKDYERKEKIESKIRKEKQKKKREIENAQ